MKPSNQKNPKRMDCMEEGLFDPLLYAEWQRDQTSLHYPEWLIERSNPNANLEGVKWNELWIGWSRRLEGIVYPNDTEGLMHSETKRETRNAKENRNERK